MKRTITEWNIACYTHTHTHTFDIFSRVILHADWSSSLLQYLASLGIQSLVQQGATQGKTAHKLMDALKDTDILHWKHSLSELIEISLAQTTSIWRMYGKRWESSAGRRSPDTPSVLLCTEGGRLVTTRLLLSHRTSALWNTLTMSQKSLYSALRDSSPQILQLFNRMPQYLKWNHPDLESF